jgi:hypothetical protein
MFQSIQHQIESYEVIDALVSYNDICCSTLFDSYVQVLYQKKQEQDDLPKDKRNDALRETIKLFLNSLSGKLIENPSNQREYKLYSSGKIEFINGEAFSEETSTSVNRLFTLGLMIYSFSKRLLFSYINCLPNQEKDVIASETDSIYIPASVVEKFEENIKSSSVYRNHSCVGIGSKLGNFAYEGSSNSPSYFLGKKQYYFGSEKPKLKFKGLREKYIDTDGTLKKVLTKRTFEELYDTGEIDVPQSILDRCLTSRCAIDKVHIESYNTMKKFRANYEFSNYDFIHNKITKN